jgi:hypothetical protein
MTYFGRVSRVSIPSRGSDELTYVAKATGIASLDAKYLGSTVESALAMARKMRTSGGTFNVDELLIR